MHSNCSSSVDSVSWNPQVSPHKLLSGASTGTFESHQWDVQSVKCPWHASDLPREASLAGTNSRLKVQDAQRWWRNLLWAAAQKSSSVFPSSASFPPSTTSAFGLATVGKSGSTEETCDKVDLWLIQDHLGSYMKHHSGHSCLDLFSIWAFDSQVHVRAVACNAMQPVKVFQTFSDREPLLIFSLALNKVLNEMETNPCLSKPANRSRKPLAGVAIARQIFQALRFATFCNSARMCSATMISW